MQGKTTDKIEEGVNELTEVLKKAINNHVPKIKRRTLPHPELDEETLQLMAEAKRLKILVVNGIDYINNIKVLFRTRKRIREKWREKKNQKT